MARWEHSKKTVLLCDTRIAAKLKGEICKIVVRPAMMNDLKTVALWRI